MKFSKIFFCSVLASPSLSASDVASMAAVKKWATVLETQFCQKVPSLKILPSNYLVKNITKCFENLPSLGVASRIFKLI